MFLRCVVVDLEEKVSEPTELSRFGTNNCLEDLLQPPDMYSDIIRELRVETGAHDIALSHSHNIVEFSSLHLGRSFQRAAFYLLGPIRQDTENLNLGLLVIVVVLVSLTNSHHHTGGYRRFILFRLRLRDKQLLHDGRPDEDAGKGGRGVRGREDVRLRQKGQRHVRHKTLDLAPKVVPVHPDGQPADEFLTALLGGVGLLCEEDESRAGTPGWFVRVPNFFYER